MKSDVSNTTKPSDHNVIADLLARRWQENRRYLSLHERSRAPRLRAQWHRMPGYTALVLHWTRPAPLDFERGPR